MINKNKGVNQTRKPNQNTWGLKQEKCEFTETN